MSKLGELIGYTGEECPNCGRVRVEKWSCGKRICEKCHWCIEDAEYLYDDEESEDSIKIGYVKNVRVLCTANCRHNEGYGYYNLCQHPKACRTVPYGGIDRIYVDKCELQEKRLNEEIQGGYVDTDIVKNFFGLNGPMEIVRKRWEATEEERLAPYKERAAALGVSVYYLDSAARMLGTDIGDYLNHIEALKNAWNGVQNILEPVRELFENNCGGEFLTDVQIRKQLKYEKNPMRIKQLNKMLYGKRKRK